MLDHIYIIWENYSAIGDCTTWSLYHNNRRHVPISIERTWQTKFWPNRNFEWCLAFTEVNTALADGHFRKGGQLIPTLQFHRKLTHEMIKNNIGVDTVDSGRPSRSTCTLAIVPCTLIKVKKHEGGYNREANKFKKAKQEYQKQRCANFKTCN